MQYIAVRFHSMTLELNALEVFCADTVFQCISYIVHGVACCKNFASDEKVRGSEGPTV